MCPVVRPINIFLRGWEGVPVSDLEFAISPRVPLNSVSGFEIGLLRSNFLQQVCGYFFCNANKFQSRFAATRFESGRKNRNFGDFSDLETPEDMVYYLVSSAHFQNSIFRW